MLFVFQILSTYFCTKLNHWVSTKIGPQSSWNFVSGAKFTSLSKIYIAGQKKIWKAKFILWAKFTPKGKIHSVGQILSCEKIRFLEKITPLRKIHSFGLHSLWWTEFIGWAKFSPLWKIQSIEKKSLFWAKLSSLGKIYSFS